MLRLEQNGQRLADLLHQIALLAGIGHALCLMRARRFDRVAELLRHGVRLRARAAGVRENMHGRKADLLQKRHCGRLICLRLAGEARDHVRRERTAREIPPQPLDAGEKLCSIIFAVHARERAVASALQREMEMPADLPGRGGAAAEVLRDDRRLDRAEAQTHLRRGGGDRLHGVGQRQLTRQIPAVGRDLDAGQHQLPIALGGQMRRLTRHFLQRQTADAAARIRDDTVGAEIIAAVLDLQHRARAAVGRARRQRLKVKALERIIHARDGRVLTERTQNVIHKCLLAAAAMYHVGADGRRVLRAELRPAAAHGAQRLRVLLAQLADHLARLAPALRRDGAGVDDDQIDRLTVRCGREAVRVQERFDCLRFILVDLAAEGGYNIVHKNISKSR